MNKNHNCAITIDPVQYVDEVFDGWLGRIETVGGQTFHTAAVYGTPLEAEQAAQKMAELYNTGVSMMNTAEAGYGKFQ